MKKSATHPSLQRIIDKTGLRMEDIADLLGVSVATVSRWARQGISQAGANKLGKLLNIDATWILMGDKSSTPRSHVIAKEAVLEFVALQDNSFVLREVGSDDAWVSIDFSDKLKEILGKETLHMIGHHMMQAGIASFMERQIRQYHAHVYDETPKHFS